MGYCARVSSNNQDNKDVTKLLRYCANHKHWSVFEMASLCIEIETSRAISAQILRHRSFHYQEFSQRYAALDQHGIHYYAARRQDTKNRQNSIDDIPDAIQQEWMARQQDNWKRAFEHYTWALNKDIAKECARMVLPLASATRLYMVGTVRDWIHYIVVRTDPSAQKEHRDVAEACKVLFCEAFPIVAHALGWITKSHQNTLLTQTHEYAIVAASEVKPAMRQGDDNV